MTRCDEGKTRYASHHDAVKALIVMGFRAWRKRKVRVARRAYPCKHCGSWHVTSQAEDATAAARRRANTKSNEQEQGR